MWLFRLKNAINFYKKSLQSFPRKRIVVVLNDYQLANFWSCKSDFVLNFREGFIIFENELLRGRSSYFFKNSKNFHVFEFLPFSPPVFYFKKTHKFFKKFPQPTKLFPRPRALSSSQNHSHDFSVFGGQLWRLPLRSRQIVWNIRGGFGRLCDRADHPQKSLCVWCRESLEICVRWTLLFWRWKFSDLRKYTCPNSKQFFSLISGWNLIYFWTKISSFTVVFFLERKKFGKNTSIILFFFSWRFFLVENPHREIFLSVVEISLFFSVCVGLI